LGQRYKQYNLPVLEWEPFDFEHPPDIPTTMAEAATTNLGMSFGSPLAIFLFDFLI
jgi:hypothetical protein